jgi:hypothetical protein
MLAKSREDRPQDPRQLQEEIETVITKLAAEFSPSPGQIAPASAPVAPEAASPADDNLELATLLPAVASPSFDHYFGIQIGSLLGDRYRLIEEEREGTGGRLFRATEEKALSGTPWISAVRFAPVEAFAQLERSAHALRAVGCNVGFRLRARTRLGQRQRPKDSGLLPDRDFSGDLSYPGSWKCRSVVELLPEAQSPLYCSALVTQPGREGQANVGSRQPGVVDDPGRGRNSWHEIRLAFRSPHLRIA